MRRRLEPEVMDTVDEARDYDAMDHAEVNRRFVLDLLAQHPPAGAATLDVGCGTALIPIELCQRGASAVIALDAAATMLALGRENVARAGLQGRIRLCRADAKRLPFPDRSFSVVVSNSLLHHLPDPRAALAELLRVTAPGGLLFGRDLFRPDDEAELARLLEAHAASATPRQRGLLADSLRAALTVEELRALVAELGLPREDVRATSDRHWTWVARP
jgi:ubiquinone/menaquinone biosynthesis C-methylase UbiE